MTKINVIQVDARPIEVAVHCNHTIHDREMTCYLWKRNWRLYLGSKPYAGRPF